MTHFKHGNKSPRCMCSYKCLVSQVSQQGGGRRPCPNLNGTEQPTVDNTPDMNIGELA
jgi:hypothetical protein